MTNIERLAPICSTDPTRPQLATPFMVDWSGRRWAVGTNGHGLAMVHFDGELRTDGPKVTAPEILPGPPSVFVADVAQLRAWIGEVSPAQVECPACKGKPPPPCKECEGSGEVDADYCDCPDCSGSHQCPKCRNKRDARGGCDQCDSTGKTAAPIRPGKIGKSVLNLNLLSWIFASAPQEGRIEIAGCDAAACAVHFRVEGWMGIAMPLQHIDGQPKDFGPLQGLP